MDIQELTPSLLAGFGLSEKIKGALISHVSENSPASSAGLQQGDIIVEFDGKPVESLSQFQLQVSMLNPGAGVQLVVLRKGERKSLTIELGMRIRRPSISSTPQPTLEVAGMAIQELNQPLADKLGYTKQKGVVVVAVAQDSIAGFSGLLPGMLITQVNQQPVQSLTQFENALREVAQNRPILFLIYNKGAYQYLVLAAPGQ